MNITLIQTEIAWEDRKKNLAHFRKLLGSVPENTQLVVLPEMFTTGFTMAPEKNAEPADGEGRAFLREMAMSKNLTITGSVAVSDDGKYFNRLFWVEPSGEWKQYDKRHLFRMAREDEHYTAGKQRLITEIGQWKFCPMVCYDLRFPVWCRNRFKKTEGKDNGKQPGHWEYDVLVFVANWPQARITHWKQLLIARAIENQCYVVGVNRIGKDGNGYAHPGASVVINPRGEVMTDIRDNEESVVTITLDKKYLDEYRAAFPAGLDADDFTINT